MLPFNWAEKNKMRLQILCIVTVITASIVTGNFCGAGWFSYKHFCFKNDTREVRYWEARQKCQEMGADLTTMRNAEETAALERSFQTVTGISRRIDLWIGLYNPEAVMVGSNSSGFRWTDGTSFNSSYDIWFGSGDRKEPNGGDQFARFYRADDNSPVKWVAVGEIATKGFICKKETWDPTSEHCLEDKCYKISASAYYNEYEARQECVKNNMTVLKQFPDSLNQTYPLDGSTPFWLDNGNGLDRQGGTWAWVMCTGPSEASCPCGWHGLDKFCYYLGVSKKNKNDAMQDCKQNGALLAMINSHTENKFIKSIVNASQRYWIGNGKNADYCYHNENYCYDNTVIQGTWKSAIEAEANYFICKKKRKDVISHFNFCLDGNSGECYNSSQIRVPPRNLNGASCASGTKILSEQMVKDRNISRNLAKAISSANMSCNRYLIKSDSDLKLLYAKNDEEIELDGSSNNNYHYICVKDIDDCSSSPCENGGTCVDGYHNFQCDCLPGYTGKQCETEVDECESQPCKHGSTCKDEVNGYSCLCSPGYTGQNCETGLCTNFVNVVLGTLLALIVAINLVVATYCCVRRNSTHNWPTGASSRSVERDRGSSTVDVHAYDEITMSEYGNRRQGQDLNPILNLKGATGDHGLYKNVNDVPQDEDIGATGDHGLYKNVNEDAQYEDMGASAPTYLELH